MPGRVFVIGASLSGIDALSELIGRLPANFPAPIFVAQHVAAHSPGMLPHILSRAGRLPASHPKSGEIIERGHVYVAPPDRHMLLRKGYISLSHGPHENLARPAVDPLFRSAAIAYGPAVVAAVLTGQLDDGTAGLLAVKDRGGTTLVQDPTEATAPSMPLSAMRHVPVDYCCRLEEMAGLLVALAADDPATAAADPTGELMAIENRIAEGIFSVEDWWELERMSLPSGLNCPNCRSALYEIIEKRVLRFRCRSGHAFSARSLLSGQAESRETLLSTLFGVLIEEATLAKRLRGETEPRRSVLAEGELQNRIATLEGEAARVCDWLHAMSGLVETEPEAGQDPGSPS